nr:olfactory receptor 14A16-like [Pogona vitticeps]
MLDIKTNASAASYFLLLEFSEVRDLQIMHFFVFLTLYLATVTGNMLIIFAIVLDHHLHTPMYLFLMNLAVVDIGSVSATIPKSMLNAFLNTRSISYFGCVAQVFFLFFFLASDFVLLTIMAHDRYVAICNPLRYETIMNRISCMQMMVSAWISGLLYGIIHTGSTFAISFCSNIVDQFFCEIPQLLKLSCTDLYLVEISVLVFSMSTVFGCFTFIILTYVKIFTAVLKIPTMQGRQKFFSTCLPHLMVVSMYICSGVLAYITSVANSPSDLRLVFGVMYSLVPPIMNPLIYSLRNKEIKVALRKILNLKDSSKNPLSEHQ